MSPKRIDIPNVSGSYPWELWPIEDIGEGVIGGLGDGDGGWLPLTVDTATQIRDWLNLLLAANR